MLKGLIGKKIEMSQSFDKHGRIVPVTKITVAANYIVQVKQTETDGYRSIQIGYEKKKKATKPLRSHAKKAGLDIVPKYLREVEFDGELQVGNRVTLDQVFHRGALVDISGLSKGKGFAGVVKRWGFSGGPRTHGQSDRERAPGSIGATTTPGRVFKGLKMAGRMGGQQTTAQGLEIIKVDNEKEELWIKGSVPGSRGSLLLINKSKKKKKAYHELEIPIAPQVTTEKKEVGEEQESKEQESLKEKLAAQVPSETGEERSEEENAGE